LRERDIITHLNGRALHSAAELRARLALTAIGEELELRTMRGTELRNVRVRIAAVQQVSGTDSVTVPQLAGMRVVEIERGSPLYQRVQGGVVIAAVEDGSRAFQAGFRAGDIIYAVNRRRIRTVAEFAAALRADRAYTVNLLRGDFNLSIVIR
jgi:S1-C subfamily serine protease